MCNRLNRRLKAVFRGEPPRRIAIFRALQLGDMLCAVPAWRALRAALPESEITLVGLPWARTLRDRYTGYLGAFREFPGWPGLPEQPPQVEQLPAFIASMQGARFDLVVQMHGSGSLTNPLVGLWGARRTAGFYREGSYRPDTDLFLPYPEHGLEVRRCLRLVEFLGLPAQGEWLEFPFYESDRQALAALPGSSQLRPGQYVCVHPGASVPERRWSAERFAAVARSLDAQGLRVVITGTTAEANLAAEVCRSAGVACLDLSGQTTLGALAALLADARLLVCNDTGVSHLADALDVPSVVISTGNNPERWAPVDQERHRVLCDARGVEPVDVLTQASRLLKEQAGRQRRRTHATVNNPDARQRQPVA